MAEKEEDPFAKLNKSFSALNTKVVDSGPRLRIHWLYRPRPARHSRRIPAWLRDSACFL